MYSDILCLFLDSNTYILSEYLRRDLNLMNLQLSELSKLQIERLKFIEFRAYFLGEIKRSDIMDYFGVGSAAATRDLALYRMHSKDGILLDQKSKVYEPASNFRPIFNHSIDQVLNALSQGYNETTDKSKSLLLSETPRVLSRPSLEILAPISRAIYRKKPVSISYYSFSSGFTQREIVPFALINNGHRWHVRAFDRKRNTFLDFVLTRIKEPLLLENSKVFDHELCQEDDYWSRLVKLELVPHPGRTLKDQRIIEMDYEMEDGVVNVQVRAAIAGYLLRQWSVDCSIDHHLSGEEHRLWLKNHPILYGIDSARLAPGYAVTK
jgi:hypothetical protein